MVVSLEKKVEIKLFNISDSEIKIEISDDGPGLPDQKMNEVLQGDLDLMNKPQELVWVLI